MASVLDGLGAGMLGALPDLMYWVGWSLFAAAVLGGIVLIYFLMDYKYKVQIFERRGSGGNSFYIGKIKKDRAKLIREKDGSFKMRLLYAKKTIDVIPDDYVYGKNQMFLSKISNDLYVPMRVDIKQDDAKFTPVDADTKAWAMNEMKQAVMDYQAKNAFEQYSQYFFMVGTVLFCLALTGLTVYFTFKYAGGSVQSIDGLSQALNNFGNTLGAAP